MEQENQQLKLANLNQTEQIMLLQDKLQGEFRQLYCQEKWRWALHPHKQSNAISLMLYNKVTNTLSDLNSLTYLAFVTVSHYLTLFC